MKILFVASEASPFVKTGGLADVAGALPKVLRQLGHDVRVAIPRYGDIDVSRFRLLPLMPEIKVEYAGHTLHGSVLRCNFPKSDMPVYFVDEPRLFARPGIYGTGKIDFSDNDERFAFFNIATLWLLKGLDWQPDVIHLNDWQTGLIPALLRHHPVIAADPFYAGIKTVFSIHNLVYQGLFDKFLIPNVGLPWDVFTQEGMEFYGKASLLKAGLAYSDALVAVSPSYAREIQTVEQGAGMEGALQHRTADVHGILNGIDLDEWNPATDHSIAATFTADDLSGKAKCKAALQKEFGFPTDPTVPLVGMISRLVEGKGLDLISESLDALAELGAQFVFLGTGEARFEEALRLAAERHPSRIAVRIGYDSVLSHRIIGGGDMFLMPSRYEPCGLTQLYSLRYGTLPVARRTGGLSDSITAWSRGNAAKATGFLFDDYSSAAMVSAVKEAVQLYRGSAKDWKKMQANAMAKENGWERSAKEYVALYEKVSAPVAMPIP